VTDTRNRPRSGAMHVMHERPSPLFYDSWAVCPERGCTCGERDNTAWFNYASARWQCNNGHVWDERYGLWEVESR
jgi:hypothetical protein